MRSRAARSGVVGPPQHLVRHDESDGAVQRDLVLVVVGATGARMSRISPGIALSMLLLTLMIQLAGFEIGAVFCRRADWERIGGYNEERLCAEDTEFLVALKRLGRTRDHGGPEVRPAR